MAPKSGEAVRLAITSLKRAVCCDVFWLTPAPDVGSTPGERLKLTPRRHSGDEVYGRRVSRNPVIPVPPSMTIRLAWTVGSTPGKWRPAVNHICQPKFSMQVVPGRLRS